MRKTRGILALLIAAALCLAMLPAAGAEAATGLQKDVVILFTSDVHCGMDQHFTYAGVKAMKDAAIAAGNHVLLVDDGDAVQGEAIGLLTKGMAAIEMMNIVGYDIAIPGNHEFDYGTDRFMEFVEKANFTYISCNIHKNGEFLLKPYVIREFDGVKIAFVGATAPETLTASTPRFFQDENGNYIYDFSQGGNGEALYTAIQESVDAARAEGADYVILMGHLGNESALKPHTYADVIANTNGIDAMLDGHSHDTDKVVMWNKDGKKITRQACGTKLSEVGWLRISAATGSIETGLYTWHNEEPMPDVLGVRNDVTDPLETVTGAIKDQLSTVIGTSEVELITRDPAIRDENGNAVRVSRRAETNLGNLCADAIRTASGADVAMYNSGSNKLGLKPGAITVNDVMNVFPFGGRVMMVEATGQQILDTLEWAVKFLPEESGGFMQVSGMSFEIHSYLPTTVKENRNGMFAGVEGTYRVQNVKIGGEPLDLNKKYKVAGLEYVMIDHGGGQTAFDGATVLWQEGRLDYEILQDYIVNTLGGTIGKDYAEFYGEGRIIGVAEAPTGFVTEPDETDPKEAAVTADGMYDIFSNDEINRLIDENYKEVLEKGYAELRIPESLHQISRGLISPNCLDAAQKLIDAGYSAYLVGGAVRDLVIREKTNDFDISTNATIEQMAKALDNLSYHTNQTGYVFAVARYPDEGIDVATYLNIPAAYAGVPGVPEFDPEQKYSDSLLFDSIERDLTMNALYYDLATGDLVDFHGGLHDLREKVLNTMIETDAQLRADPSSAIRAIRFRARYQYAFSEKMEKAMREHAKEYFSLLSSGTVGAQLPRFFNKGYARRSLDGLLEYGVFTDMFPITAELAETPEYKEYCTAAMDFMDAWFEDKGSISEQLFIPVLAWPVIEKAFNEAESQDIFTYTKIVTQTLAAEQKRCDLYSEKQETMYRILMTEYMLNMANSHADSALSRPEFESAFILLQIRAQKDESLAEKVKYWEERLEQYRKEKEAAAEAPAA